MTDDGEYVVCSHEGCDHRIKNHRWGKIKAGDIGWFFAKSGEVYCPDHTPEWVAEWRKNRGRTAGWR